MREPSLVVAYALGSLGDVNPMIALCAELARRGHRTQLLSNSHFEDEAQAAGVAFSSVGPAADYHATYSDSRIWKGTSEAGLFHHALEYHIPSSLRAFARIAELRREHPNLAVLTLGEHNGATMACERWNLPYVQVNLTPMRIRTRDTLFFDELALSRKWSGRPRIWLRRALKERRHLHRETPVGVLRRSVGLRDHAPWRSYDATRSALRLALLPHWYLRCAGAVPKSVVATGFPLFDRIDPSSRRAVDAFVAKCGRPLVFTPGSAVCDVRDFFFQAIDASRSLGLPCVLLSPHWRKVEDLMSERVLALSYAELEYLLPKSSVLVHHGGIGTCAQAIRAGIPQLIRPLQFDQFENAHRVWKLGLGAFLFRENFTAASCAQLLARLLAKSPAMSSLKTLSMDVRRINAIAASCDHIERALHLRRKQSRCPADSPTSAPGERPLIAEPRQSPAVAERLACR